MPSAAFICSSTASAVAQRGSSSDTCLPHGSSADSWTRVRTWTSSRLADASCEAGVDCGGKSGGDADAESSESGGEGGVDCGGESGGDADAESSGEGGADGGVDCGGEGGADGGGDADAESGGEGGADGGGEGGADGGADGGGDGGSGEARASCGSTGGVMCTPLSARASSAGLSSTTQLVKRNASSLGKSTESKAPAPMRTIPSSSDTSVLGSDASEPPTSGGGPIV